MEPAAPECNARFARNPYYARSTRLFKFPDGNGQKYMLNGNLGGIKGACGARMSPSTTRTIRSQTLPRSLRSLIFSVGAKNFFVGQKNVFFDLKKFFHSCPHPGL